MKNQLLFVVLLGMLAISFGHQVINYYVDPAHPGKCAVREGLVINPGTHKHPDLECGNISCNSNGVGMVETCDEKEAPAGCTFGDYVDVSRRYPDCCEKKLNC